MEQDTQPLFTDNAQDTTNSQAPTNFEELMAQQRQRWTKEIEDMNEKMKTIPKVDELLNVIYATRQKAVDYYYGMNGVILKHTREYKAMYNNMFNNIKINGYNGMRFSSDQAIARQIETDLQDKKEIIDLLTNQNNFIKDTIQTIDNLIFAIPQKTKIAEIMNGLKF